MDVKGSNSGKTYKLAVTDNGRVFTDPSTGQSMSEAQFRDLESEWTQARGSMGADAKVDSRIENGRRFVTHAKDAPIILEQSPLAAAAAANAKKSGAQGVPPAATATPMPTPEPRPTPVSSADPQEMLMSIFRLQNGGGSPALNSFLTSALGRG